MHSCGYYDGFPSLNCIVNFSLKVVSMLTYVTDSALQPRSTTVVVSYQAKSSLATSACQPWSFPHKHKLRQLCLPQEQKY